MRYINNKWNAIELEKSWTPDFGLPPKTDRCRHAKAASSTGWGLFFSPFLGTVISYTYGDAGVPVWRLGEVHSLPSLLFTVDGLNVEFPCLWDTMNKVREGRAGGKGWRLIEWDPTKPTISRCLLCTRHCAWDTKDIEKRAPFPKDRRGAMYRSHMQPSMMDAPREAVAQGEECISFQKGFLLGS